MHRGLHDAGRTLEYALHVQHGIDPAYKLPTSMTAQIILTLSALEGGSR